MCAFMSPAGLLRHHKLETPTNGSIKRVHGVGIQDNITSYNRKELWKPHVRENKPI